MKKSILLIAAMFAAFAINAAEVTVDLSNYSVVKTEGATVTPSYNSGVVKVDYTTTAGWDDVAGVSFALNNLKVTNIAFEFLGDAALSPWTSFFVYLEDSEGAKFYSSAADLSISGWEGDYKAIDTYFPTDALWCSPAYPAGEKPFVAVGFMANGGTNSTAAFSLKNVKLTVEGGTGIDNTASEVKAIKTIKDGQMVIVRDGKSYNALGAEMK